jgi:hypothetical protein
MAKVIRSLPVSVESCVLSQASPCRFYVGESDIEIGFSPTSSGFPYYYHYFLL